MKITLPDFEKARVLVVGDVMLDRYWSGPTGRISPEAPVPVVKVEHNEERPGGAANVALNVAALGAGSLLLGLTGQDEAAAALSDKLTSVGVKSDFVAVANFPTITKLRILSRNQQLLRLDFEEGFHAVDPEPLLAKMRALLPEVDVVILSDYGKGGLTDGVAAELIALCRAAGKPVLVDPKGTDYGIYRGATAVTPNRKELGEATGLPTGSDAEVEAAGRLLRESCALDFVLATRSEEGMSIVEAGRTLHMPTKARAVFDVSGAGDTVIATFALALAAGCATGMAAEIANAAAGIVVGKLGTAVVTRDELAAALN